MKKVFIGVGILFGLIVIALVLIPLIFKDDIRQTLDQTLDESLNAKVYYDTDRFSLSLIKNFPDFTVSLGGFGIAGIEEFEGDTLVDVDQFLVTIDLMSVISGDQIMINEILLNEPRITVLVMPDGKANYDIAKESTETETVEEETEESGESDISIGIQKWSIQNAQLIYLDQSMSFYTTLIGLNHEGSGDFTLDVFDLNTQTDIASASLGFEGEEYVSNKQLFADVTLNMDLSQMKFTFKENRIALNDFAIAADGFISMPGKDIEMDIDFGGKDISLKSILSLIPGTYQEYLDGVSASGEINFDGFVKGIFNENSMPKVAANLSVEKGGITYADYPIPMEEIEIKTSFNYPSADLAETSFNVDKFHMLVDGEEVSAYLKFKNLEDFNWDLGFDGNVDLEKVTKIVPLEGMELKGKINAKLNTAGKMSDVEGERYDQLPTSGSMTIQEFLFTSSDLPQGFGIQRANLSFDPSEVRLSEFVAKAGKSDMNMSGKISNYLGFALGDEKLLGNLDFGSQLLDLNEWMPEESEETDEVEETEESEPLEVVKIPENIDFTLQSNIKKMEFTNLSINDFKGRVLIKDGAIILDENTFQMLDGTFSLAGSYRTKDLDKPKYDFSFDIKELSIPSAFNSFEVVQSYVPIAKQVTGKFSTNLTVDGTLGADMMPEMDEMNMSGLVNIAQAALQGGGLVDKVSAVTSLKGGGGSSTESKGINIKDVLISTAIRNGRLFVEPFDLEVNGQKASVGGSNSLDGDLDYAMLMKDIPTGQIGDALNSAISSFTGGQKLISDKIDLNLGIGGTYDDPQVKLLGSSPSSGGSSGASASFKDQMSSKVDDEKAKAEAELERQKVEAEARLAEERAEAEAKAKAAADSTKAALEAKRKAAEEEAKRKLEEEKKKAEEAAKDKVKDLFKRKN